MSNKHLSFKISNYVKSFLFYFISVISVILTIFITHSYFLITYNQSKLKDNEKKQLLHFKYLVKERLNLMINDVELLTSYIQDHTNKHLSSHNKQLSNLMIKIIETRPFYDQIRFLNSNGREIIRINNVQGKVKYTPKTQLQDKGDRYYFKSLKYTNKNSIYISRLDWNIEGGKLEYPLKATIRIGKPIFINNKFIGAILINYHAYGLINQLISQSDNTHQVFIINNSGYSVISASSAQLMEPKKLFRHERPILWQAMINNLSGSIYDKNTLYTYDYINPSFFKQRNIHPWWLVSSSPKMSYLQFWYLIPLYAAIGFLAFFVSALFAHFHIRNKKIQSLHQFAESYRQVLKKIQLAAITIDQNGTIEFCNDYFLSLTGFSKEKLVGMSFMKVCIPDQLRHQLQNKINQAFSHQQNFRHYTSLLKRTDESIKIMNWTITYSPALTHQSHFVTLVGEDITAQVLNEDQLLRLSHIVEQSPFGVILTNPEGTVIYANKTYTEMSNLSSNDILNKPTQLLDSILEPSLKETIFHHINQDLHWTGEVQLNLAKSDHTHWLRLAISTIKEQDQLLYIVILLQDINEEKKLAKQVQQESQKRQTSEKLAATGQAATTIAHDLRNPLCSIKMALQMSQRHHIRQTSQNTKQPNQNNELFTIALEQISYMEKTLEDLLSFSRPEKLMPKWISIDQLIESVLSCQYKLIQDNHIDISFKIDKKSPNIFADETKIRSILQNLLINAIQATFISPVSKRNIIIKTSVTLDSPNPTLKLIIENNGETINKEELDKIFQPFYTTKNKGTGLGLAIVNQLILQHQGSIILEPMTPLGTRAILYLPIDYTRLNRLPDDNQLEFDVSTEQ